ncbi:hypothetical protein EV182_002274 [Spiromyces aspiralis]|uniref:Uncharacterized protein n=1 Tax=Spiromyces aspiralis TaxID=68401 RepID=A0ACC1HEA5_9FUNG|nr:hypothetical protein EV182_002274 [Spiromyces aspiralis]
MNLSSAIPVFALDIQPTDHVLDMCAAPGIKLLLTAEFMAQKWMAMRSAVGSEKGTTHFNCADEAGYGTVTGVDIHRHRALNCRSLVSSVDLLVNSRIRLYVSDATKFDTPPPHDRWWDIGEKRAWLAAQREEQARIGAAAGKKAMHNYLKSRFNSQLPWHASKALRDPFSLGPQGKLYDKVLIDAECTHDGSMSSISKYRSRGLERLATDVLNPERLKQVCNLQSRLLENGWRLLRPGGLLVYSTCSLLPSQNEQVVLEFLDRHSDTAVLEPIPQVKIPSLGPQVAPGVRPADEERMINKLRHCVRLDPRVSNTSGMFIARLRKCSGFMVDYQSSDAPTTPNPMGS